MYRTSLAMATEGEKPAAELVDNQDPQFLQRVGALPIVTAAIHQLTTIYESTKESNRYVKYTLETAEVGVKKVADTAVPMVTKLEKPISALDSMACSQLDKLEEKCPIITKPAEEVVEETKKVYDSTLKTHVDRAVAVKDNTVEKVTAAKQYAVDTVTAVKDYGVNTVTAVKDYSTDKVSAAATYSTQKFGEALETPTGKTIVSKVDQMLETTEQYVDYYLPEEKTEGEAMDTEKEKDEEEESMMTPEVLPKTTATRVASVSDKVRRRMYAKSMRELQNIQRRSKETLDRLNFTVDLIEYARVNIDGAKGKVSAAKEKFMAVWDEINKEEATEIEMDDMGDKGSADSTSEPAQVESVTLERRAIATARHLTSQLKRGFSTMTNTFVVLPTSLQTQITSAKNFTETLYTNFTNAKTLQDIPQNVVTQTREQVTQLQETITSYTEYLRNSYFGSWLGEKQTVEETSKEETEEKTRETVANGHEDEEETEMKSAPTNDTEKSPMETN